jgi:hypothetical protein
VEFERIWLEFRAARQVGQRKLPILEFEVDVRSKLEVGRISFIERNSLRCSEKCISISVDGQECFREFVVSERSKLSRAIVGKVEAAPIKENGLGKLAAADADICIFFGVASALESRGDASFEDCVESCQCLGMWQFSFSKEVFRKVLRGVCPEVWVLRGDARTSGQELFNPSEVSEF